MTMRDDIFAAQLRAGQAAALRKAPAGTHPAGPNPLLHIDHPTQGSVLRPIASHAHVPSPLNQPAEPMPRTRITGGVLPAAWPKTSRRPATTPELFGSVPYRGPWTGYGKNH